MPINPEKIRVIADEIFYMGEKVATLEPSAILSFREGFISFIEIYYDHPKTENDDWAAI